MKRAPPSGQSRIIILGPGPARYQLPPAIGVPNHDPRKWKAPAYSLTGGAKAFKGTGVPGKVYFEKFGLASWHKLWHQSLSKLSC